MRQDLIVRRGPLIATAGSAELAFLGLAFLGLARPDLSSVRGVHLTASAS